MVSFNVGSTSSDFKVIVRGSPETVSRPRTSISSFRCPGTTVPISIFTFSAVRSPICKLYFFFTKFKISMFNRSPAIFNDRLATISPNERNAISLVPPPISMTMFPNGLKISKPAPTAETFGSSSK